MARRLILSWSRCATPSWRPTSTWSIETSRATRHPRGPVALRGRGYRKPSSGLPRCTPELRTGCCLAGTSLALVEVHTSAEEALRGAHELGLTDVEADVLITLAGLDEAGGDRDAALDRLTPARDLARTGGHHGAQLRAEYNIGIMRYYAGDIAGALDQLPRAVALAERKGLTWSPYGVEARAVSVIALYVAGQWDASMEAAALAGARPPAWRSTGDRRFVRPRWSR